MAYSPPYRDVITPEGVTRVHIRYVRPFTQTVRVRFCWLYEAGIEHVCDEMGCWSEEEDVD